MAVPVIANRRVDIGVNRDANADVNKNVDDDNLVTSIGVNVTSAGADTNLRDLPSMPNHKTRIEKDGPVPFNPKTGNTGKYQR